MEEQKRFEIDRKVAQYFLGKKLHLGEIANLKRDIGNASQEIGIPQNELLEYAKITTKEIFDSQIAALGKHLDKPRII